MSDVVQTRAIVQQGSKFVEKTVQLPQLQPFEILVRVAYAALNPTDKLALDVNAFGDGAVLGCDFAGTVERVGSDVSDFKVGDRVAAFIWGGERPGVGAYSEFCIADSSIAFKVPNNISLEQASTIPLAATTAYLALYSPDCLHIKPSQKIENPITILGGASSVGSFALQLAAINSLPAIATASSKNHDIVTSDGARQVFDYTDSSAATQIRDRYPNTQLLFDTIGNPSSVESAKTILGSNDSTICTVRPGKAGCEGFEDSVKVVDVFVFTAFLKEHSYRGKAFWPPNEANHALGKKFHAELHDLIAQGKIRPRPVKNLGQLSAESVLAGIDTVREGKLSNEKVTFTGFGGGE